MDSIPEDATCDHCGGPLLRKHNTWQRFCTVQCRLDAYNFARHGHIPSETRALAPSAIGAISELAASADLMLHGYEVYRAVSPSAPCDLIATYGTNIIRVQVRTGHFLPNGGLYYPQYRKDEGRHDMIAAVVDGKDVFYFPSLPDTD